MQVGKFKVTEFKNSIFLKVQLAPEANNLF